MKKYIFTTPTHWINGTVATEEELQHLFSETHAAINNENYETWKNRKIDTGIFKEA